MTEAIKSLVAVELPLFTGVGYLGLHNAVCIE